MTAPTPQQMRELAAKHWLPIPHEQEVAAALRTAADQLEAVQAEVAELETDFEHALASANVAADRLDAVRGLVTGWPDGATFTASAILHALTADTAPQEGRDE